MATPAELEPSMGRGPFTVEDLRAMGETKLRHELIDGALLVNASPSRPHQFVSSGIFRALHKALPPELVVMYEIDVAVGESVLVPDLVVCDRDAYFGDSPELPAEAVLLAVEVVSKSSRRMDRFLKPQMYAEAGVPSYWRVEIEDGTVRIATYQLRDGSYAEGPSASGSDVLRVEQPVAVEVDLTTLRAG